MASTAYGGSSQLTDLYTNKSSTYSPMLQKHKFHIQGDANILDGIKNSLDSLIAQKANLFPTTVLFIEIPTNPDMKVPVIEQLAIALMDYERVSGKNVLLLVDTTFAPGSKVIGKLKRLLPGLNVMVFISLSKSVSRGLTTAGALVSNHTTAGKELIQAVGEISTLLDTGAKPDQIHILCMHHKNVEERCFKAYNVALNAGKVLVKAVEKYAKKQMKLAFVSQVDASEGFTTSTFSFNLPSPDDPANLDTLAQHFVDLLCSHRGFKPCVSFGQDNALVYCTVPATSTQGAISEADKAKQAVGGVQLVRLSFPPTCDEENVAKAIEESVFKIYNRE